MAYTANTHFAVKVSNISRNHTQNVAGKFGTGTGSSFAAADCSAGTLCVQNGLIPSEGYEGVLNTAGTPAILNGNTWYFNAATAASATTVSQGDHTGIYACNSYDVNKVGSGDLIYNLGAQTLGLGVPANQRGTFTELIVGEQYEFGAGNFATAPSSAQIYATLGAGNLVPRSSIPSDTDLAVGGVYFMLMRTENLTEGTTNAGTGYVLKVMRKVVSAT